MDCPKCGGPTYDNRQKKASGQYKPTAPDFACRDKEGCGWKKFPPKGQNGAVQGNGARRPTPPLAQTYNNCFSLATQLAAKHLKTATSEDIRVIATTMFIEHNRSGAPLVAPKPVAPPPPPKPAVEDYEDYPEALNEPDDSLPF